MTTKPYHCQHCGKPIDFEDDQPHEDIGGPDAFSWIHAACAKAWHAAHDTGGGMTAEERKQEWLQEVREEREYESGEA